MVAHKDQLIEKIADDDEEQEQLRDATERTLIDGERLHLVTFSFQYRTHSVIDVSNYLPPWHGFGVFVRF